MATPPGEFAHTLTVTNHGDRHGDRHRHRLDGEPSGRNKAQKWVLAALSDIVDASRCWGIDSDNGSEFINAHVLTFCTDREGYHRYTGEIQVDLLNGVYALLRDQSNFFAPQQKLVSKTGDGTKVIKKHDTAKTPFHRVRADPAVDIADKATLKATPHHHYLTLSPAAIRRKILGLGDALNAEVTTNDFPTKPLQPLPRGHFHEATNRPTRTS